MRKWGKKWKEGLQGVSSSEFREYPDSSLMRHSRLYYLTVQWIGCNVYCEMWELQFLELKKKHVSQNVTNTLCIISSECPASSPNATLPGLLLLCTRPHHSGYPEMWEILLCTTLNMILGQTMLHYVTPCNTILHHVTSCYYTMLHNSE